MHPARSGDAIQWYRVKIDRGRLKGLTAKDDAKGLVQALSILLIIAATGAVVVLAFAYLPWWTLIPLLFLHGTVYAFLNPGVHELSHKTVFKTRWLNEVFVRIYSFLSWRNFQYFRASHQRHHLYTLHPPDDLEIELPMPYTWWDILSRTIVDPYGLVTIVGHHIRVASGRVKGQWEHILYDNDSDTHKRVVRWAWIMLIGHLANCALFFALGLWIIPILTTFGIFYGGMLRFFCNAAQHAGLADKVDDFRLNSRTFEAHPIVQYLYWQMNYHIEHHMYAAVPFHQLPILHREIRHSLPPVAQSLREVWKQIFEINHRQKKDPDYVYYAPLPEPPEQGGGS